MSKDKLENSNHHHHHLHTHDHSDGHSHPKMESPGDFTRRELIRPGRDFSKRAFTVGIGGPVGSGKTALLLELCKRLKNIISLGVVTNDIFTREDAEFLLRNKALDENRIVGVETGGCPHAAIREDISINLEALDELGKRFPDNLDLLFVESGGDNLAAHFGMELVDYTIYVIDVSGGDKIPRKGGPGITQADLLVINKTDLAALIGADLAIMERDSLKMRKGGPFIFTQIKNGLGVPEIIDRILAAKKTALLK